MKLRLPGRFERKILAALFIIASLPLGAAAYLLSVTLGRISNITDQHQKEVRRSLGGAVEVYRVYFSQMKDTFRERTGEVAATPFEHAADLASVPDLLRARVLHGDQVIDEWSVSPEIFEHTREAPPNLIELPSSQPGAPRLLELTFGISREMYANFLTLRQAMDREQELDRAFPLIFPMIFRGLALALVIILALATVLGLFVARRATERVADLRAAARRVGEGDLTVRLRPRGNDELDELGRAFDRMVAELGEARSRLSYLQKVSAWQEVARRLAHEIKNPLTPIQLAVQELGSKYRGDDPSYARLLGTAQEILKEEIDSMRRLVDDFSAFAKLPKVEPAPVDLGQVVEDFVRGHTGWQPYLRFDKPPARIEALCDRMLIRRVLTNLVENAMQAAEGVGRVPEIVLRVEAEPDRDPDVDGRSSRVDIVVDDNGPGVPAGSRERIFDPYVTTKENGTGLGLAIVRKIVIDHGGDVSLAAVPSPLGGARFRVAIPVGGPEAAEAPAATSEPDPAASP
jgi:two-component system, NtrC family, nitrogen regulation sensor histidine kinase NtrY